MADTKPNPPEDPAVSQGSPKTPDLVGLAGQCAAQVRAGSAAGPVGSGSPPARNLGGRRPKAVEAQEWLAANNLRAVPLDSAEGPAHDAGILPPEDAFEVDPEFVREAIKELVTGISEWRKGQTYRKLAPFDPKGASELAEEAGAPPGSPAVIAKAGEAVLAKYGMAQACGPETILAGACLIWLGKDMILNRKIDALLAEIKASRKPQDKAPAAPAPAP